jgi:hypothetical protein
MRGRSGHTLLRKRGISFRVYFDKTGKFPSISGKKVLWNLLAVAFSIFDVFILTMQIWR